MIKNYGGTATEIKVYAGMKENVATLGMCNSVKTIIIDSNWYNKIINNQYVDKHEEDWAGIILNEDLGYKTGWMGMQTFENYNWLVSEYVNITGFPSDWGHKLMQGYDKVMSADNQWLKYHIDTYEGQSGAPIVYNNYVIGVHTLGSEDWQFNQGVTLNNKRFYGLLPYIN